MSENQIISFLEFVNQDDEDKYNMLVESASIIRQKETIIKGLDNTIDNLNEVLQQKENIIKDIKAQLDYLETYSSKGDVFEDMSRRLNNIEKIIDKETK